MLTLLTAKFRRKTAAATTAGAGAFAVPLPPLDSDDEPRYRPIEWWLVKRMLAMLGPYRKQYAVAVVCGLVHVFLDMQSPRFIQHLADYVTAFRTPGALNVTQSGAIRHLLLVIGLWTLIFAGSVLLQRLTILLMTRAGEAVQFTFRRKLFEHLQRLSMSYYDKTKLGRIISRCTSDIGAMREANVWGLFRVANNTMMMAVAAGYLLYTDVRLFRSVAWLGVVLFYCNRVFLKRTGSLYQMAREGYTRVSTN